MKLGKSRDKAHESSVSIALGSEGGYSGKGRFKDIDKYPLQINKEGHTYHRLQNVKHGVWYVKYRNKDNEIVEFIVINKISGDPTSFDCTVTYNGSWRDASALIDTLN